MEEFMPHSRFLALRWLLAAVPLLVVAGCGKSEPTGKETATPPGQRPAVQIADPSPPKVTPAIPVSTSGTDQARLQQSFKKAVLFDVPDGEQRPPDLTCAGKNVAKIYESVANKLWDDINLLSPDGKILDFQAHIKTDLGTVVIQLYPDKAPNHVRNFIALARAGYYDGLPFHRAYRYQPKEGDKSKPLAFLETGCPKGTGEIGYGSIGYWLAPEIDAQLKHEEGAVGAWHSEALETAACKFYITLTPMPLWDGGFTIFGKVTQGLDVARTINSRPVHMDDFGDRPVDPVLIREIKIH
jgi:peptidyl-prolyl cis-trans isomerase B (cyclophilin B)